VDELSPDVENWHSRVLSPEKNHIIPRTWDLGGIIDAVLTDIGKGPDTRFTR
jgi:hypothetical protein